MACFLSSPLSPFSFSLAGSLSLSPSKEVPPEKRTLESLASDYQAFQDAGAVLVMSIHELSSSYVSFFQKKKQNSYVSNYFPDQPFATRLVPVRFHHLFSLAINSPLFG